jgi:hypothetical protein
MQAQHYQTVGGLPELPPKEYPMTTNELPAHASGPYELGMMSPREKFGASPVELPADSSSGRPYGRQAQSIQMTPTAVRGLSQDTKFKPSGGQYF